MASLLHQTNAGATGVPTARFLQAAKACDLAAAARSEQERMAALMAVMRESETIRLALMEKRLARLANMPRHERCGLEIDGEDVGYVEATLPADLAFSLIVDRERFGLDGLMSDEGLRDIQRHYGIGKTKYVSRRPQFRVAWKGGRARRAGVHFGRGTLDLTT